VIAGYDGGRRFSKGQIGQTSLPDGGLGKRGTKASPNEDGAKRGNRYSRMTEEGRCAPKHRKGANYHSLPRSRALTWVDGERRKKGRVWPRGLGAHGPRSA